MINKERHFIILCFYSYWLQENNPKKQHTQILCFVDNPDESEPGLERDGVHLS